MRWGIASLIVLTAGLAVLGIHSDWGRALTSMQARKVAVAREPLPLPPVRLQNQDGRSIDLASFRGRPLLMHFVYTRCTTLCPATGAVLAGVRRDLAAKGLESRVAFLTISFDPEHDKPEALRAFGRAEAAGDTQWQVARPTSTAELKALLRACGVKIVPDGQGGFAHDTAIYLVDRDGRLCGIYDLDEVKRIVARVESAS